MSGRGQAPVAEKSCHGGPESSQISLFGALVIGDDPANCARPAARDTAAVGLLQRAAEPQPVLQPVRLLLAAGGARWPAAAGDHRRNRRREGRADPAALRVW